MPAPEGGAGSAGDAAVRAAHEDPRHIRVLEQRRRKTVLRHHEVAVHRAAPCGAEEREDHVSGVAHPPARRPGRLKYRSDCAHSVIIASRARTTLADWPGWFGL